ncbi:coil containing protein [Vibrio phage 2.275.O._10N.286.54.E11]|nr:coil containing protein [Vibrio phage 2.275.O._10N.286.54.E11]
MSDQEYIPPTQEEKDECMARIRTARTKLIVSKPFFGILATKLIPMENDTWCQTMATDGKHLYYNVRFLMGVTDPTQRKIFETKIRKAQPDATDEQVESALKGKTDKEILFIICHEILHCAYNHFIRRGHREPQRWNRAADYAINQLIYREGIGDMPEAVLYDRKFDNMAAEEIYKHLEENPQDDTGSSLDQHPQPGQGPGSEGGDDDGNSKGSVSDIMNGNGPSISEDELEENMEDFQQTMMQAASAGDAPGGIERLINQMKEPQICWRDMLQRTLRSHIKHDQSYMSPNRRSWNMGVIFPGMMPDNEIDIAIALDMSGSISVDMARDFISEVWGITETFSQFKIYLMTFDTRVYNPQEFDPSNVEELFTYDVQGGGGTDFDCVFNHLKEVELVPDQLVMFTDGYPWNSWGDPDYCETLFVTHTSKNESPFGVTVFYELEGDRS